MTAIRASLSLSAPNERWIQNQIDSGEFSSRSEVINDLIRRARERTREVDFIRAKLIAAEESVSQHGWVTETPEEMLKGFKEKARRDGLL